MRHQHPPKREERSDERTARTGGRDRGVSEIIGAILLFGLLIIVLTLIQANAVPDANKKLEFQHNERLHGDFVNLDADFETTAETGNARATVVEMGLRYPPRFFLFNPPPAAGALRTGASEFAIQNAVAQGNDETADYWDGGVADPSRFEYPSRSLSYAPSYNVYAGAPVTTYTHGAVVNRFRDGTVRPVDDAAFVNGKTISLVALDGERDASQVDSLSLEAAPLATETRTVRVTDSGSPIVITIQTDLSASAWSDLLSEEPNVVDVRDVAGSDAVEVELRQGVTYDLRLAKLGVGPGVEDTGPAYMTSDMPTDLAVDVGGSRPLTVEVRDAFNGPQPGVPVTFTTTEGSVDRNPTSVTVTTDDEGQATVQFVPSPTEDAQVTAEADFDGDGVEAHERVEFSVAPRGTGDDNTLNPIGSVSALKFEGAVVRQEPSTGPAADRHHFVDIEFDNAGDAPIDVSAMRVNFYFRGASGAPPSGPPEPDTAVLDSLGGQELEIRGGFEAVDWTVDSAGDTLTIEFTGPETGGRTNYAISELDFFVLTVEYPDGRISSYIISPEEP